MTASAVLRVIRWDLPLPVAVGEPVGEPVQRLWKLAGNEWCHCTESTSRPDVRELACVHQEVHPWESLLCLLWTLK